MNTTSVDAYLQDGCGRCDHYQSPACKVHQWTAPLQALRAVVREAGLVEEMKWGSPCYTLNGANVVMLVSFKDCCALQFMRGAALHDADGVLEAPGPNSHIVRLLKFRSLAEVQARLLLARQLVTQAIGLVQSGVQVPPRAAPEPVPVELAERLAVDAALQQAFDALTPGRRRSHILHIGGAKQTETRTRRVEQCAPEILAGRGFHER